MSFISFSHHTCSNTDRPTEKVRKGTVVNTSRNMPSRKEVSVLVHYLPSSGPPSDTKYISFGEKARASILPL